MSSERPKILVIRGGAIGDFILTLPVLAALRAQFPHAHLEVLGYPHIAQLALAGGLADAVAPIEARAMAAFFARGADLPEPLAHYFAGFALIISYLYDPDYIFRTNLALCSPAQYLAGPHRPEEQQGVHATEVFLKPLERLAIFGADPAPRLTLRGVDRDRSLADRRAPWLAAHPGSGSEQKNWPEKHWAELLGKLAADTEWHLLLVGGEAEGDRLERLAAVWPKDRLQLARSLPLVQLAGLLAACDGYLGHDSGITHLAAALGIPNLVLWAQTDPAVWAPRDASTQLLRPAGGLADLEPSTVRARLLEFFPPKEHSQVH